MVEYYDTIFKRKSFHLFRNVGNDKVSKDEFCQIELNYFDYKFQDAKGKVELLEKWNIPVWVMEPVRGGQLATLSDEATDKLKAVRPDEDVPAWSFRFLQSIPSVVVTLSGMSNMEQLKANVKTYEENKPLNEADREIHRSSY